MKTLLTENYQKAREYILTAGRPLEQAMFCLRFEDGSVEDVIDALAAFQNPDGGFGNALESDLRMPDSSVIATTVGMQIIRRLKLPGIHPMVDAAVSYLARSYDPGLGKWPAVTPAANQYPHAPWWEYDATRQASMAETTVNPSVEVVGYLTAYPDHAGRSFIENTTAQAILYLNRIPDSMGMHDFLCYQRLASELSGPRRQRIIERLRKALPAVICLEPNDWSGYVAMPLYLAGSPDSPFADLVPDGLQANLDYMIENQNRDGSWSPNWSWYGSFPEAWTQAEQEWKAKLTLITLEWLRNFSRLE
jgi:hypothetical protein